jgi:thiaminase/transcriptional activator TenA
MDILEKFWKAAEETYRKIIEHPFNKELAKGSLPEDKFRFYLSQDAIYIGEYSRALAALASRAPSHSLMMEFVSFAKEGLEIERELHEHFMKAFQVQEAKQVALSTESYANFLLSTVAFRSFEEAMAALLPCFWLYNAVAVHIHTIAQPGNKYQKWIDTYSGAEFDQTTERLKEMTSEFGKNANSITQKQMEKLFVRSAQYEWFFWDSAYQKKFW